MKKFNKFLSGALAVAMTVLMIPSSIASAETYSLPGGGQKSGDLGGGYHYELWIDSTGGNGSMSVNSSGGEFDAVWDCSVPRGNYLARNGKLFDRKKKATEYGTITMDYEASYQQTGSNNGNSRLCVYGWMIEPSSQEVIEYYIIEDWVSWVPSPDGSFAARTVNIDGGDYDIFWIWHEGPTIKGGSERFKQYFSVRKDKRTSGRITVSDHFAEWEKAGMNCFNLTEVALNAEGYQSSGRANVTKNVITVGTPEPTEPPTEPPTDSNGYYFYDTFESDMGDWGPRGEDTVAASSSAAYKGSKSAAVTNLSDYWNGIGRTLSTSVFKPGNAYSFSAMAMQNTTSSEHFKLSLEYTDSSGEKNWDTIAEADGNSGKWVQLSNTSYTIPSGASGMTLYVETDDTTTPFFVDEMVGGVKGAAYQADVAQPTDKPTEPDQPSPGTATKYGDVDLSGSVDILDVITLNKSLMIGEKLSDVAKANADVDRDGNINETDSLNILKYIVELIDKLPIGDAPYVEPTQPQQPDPTEPPTQPQTEPPTQPQTEPPTEPPTQPQPQGNKFGIQDKGSPMRENQKMVSDFRTGNPGDFYASDGWTNGSVFDCWWHESNTSLDGGCLTLTIDQDKGGKGMYSGAEYRTNEFYHYGYYECSLQAIKNDGVVTSFFTYTGPSDKINGVENPWDEIDVEVLGKDTTKVQFNYYHNSKGGHEFMYDLGFDASEGFHTYGFDWYADHITWYVDGKEAHTMYGDMPKVAGKIMMNTWPGVSDPNAKDNTVEWLKPFNGRTPLTGYYQWVTYGNNLH